MMLNVRFIGRKALADNDVDAVNTFGRDSSDRREPAILKQCDFQRTELTDLKFGDAGVKIRQVGLGALPALVWNNDVNELWNQRPNERDHS